MRSDPHSPKLCKKVGLKFCWDDDLAMKDFGGHCRCCYRTGLVNEHIMLSKHIGANCKLALLGNQALSFLCWPPREEAGLHCRIIHLLVFDAAVWLELGNKICTDSHCMHRKNSTIRIRPLFDREIGCNEGRERPIQKSR